MTDIYKPEIISKHFFMENIDKPVSPMVDISIPKITIPSHLLPRAAGSININPLAKKIRYYFNNATPQSISIIKPKLHEYITLNMQSLEDYVHIVEEIFENFLVNSEVIKDYMDLLNHVQQISVEIDGKTRSIGTGFVNKCGEVAHEIIGYAKIRNLVMYDLSNDDDLDKYNRYKDRVKNLFITICHLYNQRHSTPFSVNVIHIYPLLNQMINLFKKCVSESTTNKDKSEANTFKKMSNVYAGFIYVFIAKERTNFIKDKNCTNQSQYMSNIVLMFDKDVVPHISDNALLSLITNAK